MSEKFKKGLILIFLSLLIVFLAVFVSNFLINDFAKIVEKINSSTMLKPLVLGAFILIVLFEIYKYSKKKLQK